MDKYTKKWVDLILLVQNDEEALSDIVDKIYTEGFEDGESSNKEIS